MEVGEDAEIEDVEEAVGIKNGKKLLLLGQA